MIFIYKKSIQFKEKAFGSKPVFRVFDCIVSFVYESRYDMIVFKVEVVIRSINIYRYKRCELCARLVFTRVILIKVVVTLIENINHTFSVRITKVRVLRRPQMNHYFVDRILCLILYLFVILLLAFVSFVFKYRQMI
jgi:hypothetical protein